MIIYLLRKKLQPSMAFSYISRRTELDDGAPREPQRNTHYAVAHGAAVVEGETCESSRIV